MFFPPLQCVSAQSHLKPRRSRGILTIDARPACNTQGFHPTRTRLLPPHPTPPPPPSDRTHSQLSFSPPPFLFSPHPRPSIPLAGGAKYFFASSLSHHPPPLFSLLFPPQLLFPFLLKKMLHHLSWNDLVCLPPPFSLTPSSPFLITTVALATGSFLLFLLLSSLFLLRLNSSHVELHKSNAQPLAHTFFPCSIHSAKNENATNKLRQLRHSSRATITTQTIPSLSFSTTFDYSRRCNTQLTRLLASEENAPMQYQQCFAHTHTHTHIHTHMHPLQACCDIQAKPPFF